MLATNGMGRYCRKGRYPVIFGLEDGWVFFVHFELTGLSWCVWLVRGG